jgi:hypothetical protein
MHNYSTQTILAPAAVLALWSMIMLLWVIVTRFPHLADASKKMLADQKQQQGPHTDGRRYSDVEKYMPASANWKSHNYTHLMEQPTVFYAVVGILALAGQGNGLNTWLAWGYVGLRIVHSVWQSTINKIPVRIALFALSSLCLIALAVHAVMATLLR